MGDAIHRAFQDVGGFGSPRASIGSSRRFIGENARHFTLYSLQLVGAAKH